MNRRDFFKIVTTSGAAAAVGGCQQTAEHILSAVVPNPEMVPGVASYYATVCRECPAGCGVLARNRDGRVVKLEGNPDHPVSQGALCVRGQAEPAGALQPRSVCRSAAPRRRRPAPARLGRRGQGGDGAHRPAPSGRQGPGHRARDPARDGQHGRPARSLDPGPRGAAPGHARAVRLRGHPRGQSTDVRPRRHPVLRPRGRRGHPELRRGLGGDVARRASAPRGASRGCTASARGAPAP